MPSSIPDIDGSECASLLPITISSTDWTTTASSDFFSFASGLALTANRRLVAVIVRNSSASGSVWISGRSDLTTESPATVQGAVEIAYGESLTLGLYGTGATTLAYAGDVGSTCTITATFWPT